MGEIIAPFKSRKGRPPLYDWDLWADGKSRRLHRGEDFNAELLSFRTMVHRKARDLGLRAETQINAADQTVNVQFLEKS